jgi:hypothetical protein
VAVATQVLLQHYQEEGPAGHVRRGDRHRRAIRLRELTRRDAALLALPPLTRCVCIIYLYRIYICRFWPHACQHMLDILSPSTKECNSRFSRSQTFSTSTKII